MAISQGYRENGSGMDPLEERTIRKWHDTLADDIEIRLLLTEDRRRDEFVAFVERLSQLAPKVHIREERTDEVEVPSILISRNISYYAIPAGKELEPFLEALALSGKPEKSKSPDVQGFENISIPAYLDLYVALQCAFCPTAVRRLTALAMESNFIRLSIIDAALFSELAEKNGVRSVPTVLLDGQYRWTGNFKLQDVVDMMIHRDPAKLSAASMESMLKEGNAEAVAQMMLDHGTIFPAFIDLLVHEKWPVRLGAMVAMETVMDKNMELAVRSTDPLWERFQQVEDPVKGDMLYILGEVGDERMLQKLESVICGLSDDELRKTAGEAIERIKARFIREQKVG